MMLLFKVDFKRAFDSAEWRYLNDIMTKINVPTLWRECISKATACVLVNGWPTYEFCFESGLREGDPLSPYLFLIVAEGLNVMINALVSANLFSGYKVRHSDIVCISHFQFADDTLLVGTNNIAHF